MADDFSFLTDSDEERAVEDVLSQAMDHSVLQQVAAINCSSFSSSDNLPFHLETRFRKLKSLPTSTSTSTSAGSRFPPSKSKSLRPQFDSDSKTLDESLSGFCNSVNFKQTPDRKKGLDSFSSIDSPKEPFDRDTDEKKGLRSKSPSDSSNENPNSELSEKCPDVKKGLESKSGIGSSKSPSDSWSLSSSPESLSPPRRIGCLWCSPKKEKADSTKKGKENRLSSSSSWSKDGGHFRRKNRRR